MFITLKVTFSKPMQTNWKKNVDKNSVEKSQLAGSRPVSYKQCAVKEWHSGLARANPLSSRAVGLNFGPPDYSLAS